MKKQKREVVHEFAEGGGEAEGEKVKQYNLPY